MTVDLLALARARVSSISDETLRGVCERVMDEVASRVATRSIADWTFLDISGWVGRPPTDNLVQMCLSILVDTEGAPILEMHFLFFDPAIEDDEGDTIPDELVQDAFAVGYLVNPNDGYPIDNFERYLAPYFVPTHQLIEQLQGDGDEATNRPAPRR